MVLLGLIVSALSSMVLLIPRFDIFNRFHAVATTMTVLFGVDVEVKQTTLVTGDWWLLRIVGGLLVHRIGWVGKKLSVILPCLRYDS